MPVTTPRIIAKTVDCSFRWLGPQGQECENVFQFQYPDVNPTSGQLTALAAAVAARMLPKYQAMQTSDIVYTEVFCKDIDNFGTGAEGTYTFPTGTHGNLVEDALPSSAACNVVLNGIVGGRTHQGAKRSGGHGENDVTKDTLLNGLLGVILDWALAMLTAYLAGGMTFEPAIGSLKNGTSTVLQSVAITNNYVDSQKTRLIPHGR